MMITRKGRRDMACRFIYEDFPADKQAQMEHISESVRPMLPAWLRGICFRYDASNDDGSGLSTNVQPEYRQSGIVVYKPFWDEDYEDQRRMLIHEIIHAPLWPLTNMGDKIIENMPDSEAKNIVKEQWRVCMESAVQDLAFMMHDFEGHLVKR